MPGTVVLVHGLAASAASTWREAGWLDLLADAGRTAIAPDLPGHGSTPLPPPGEPIDLAAHLLDQLPEDGEPVDAVGFSLGARTVLLAAAARPERFGRIVLGGVGDNLFRQDDSSEALAAAFDSDDPDEPTARYFLDHAGRSGADPKALARLLREHRPRLTADDYARITMPALVVIGDKDFAGPGEPLAEALPDATLVTLRGVDHFSLPKDFGFLDAALDFLGAAL